MNGVSAYYCVNSEVDCARLSALYRSRDLLLLTDALAGVANGLDHRRLAQAPVSEPREQAGGVAARVVRLCISGKAPGVQSSSNAVS